MKNYVQQVPRLATCHEAMPQRLSWETPLGQQPPRERWLVSKLDSYFYQQSTMSLNDSVTSTTNKSMSLKLQEKNSDIKLQSGTGLKPTIRSNHFLLNTWSRWRIMFNGFRDLRLVTKLCRRGWDERRHWGQQPTRERWLVSKLDSYFCQQSTRSLNDSVTSAINKSMSLKLQERNSDPKTSI